MSEICTTITPFRAKNSYGILLNDAITVCGKDSLKKEEIEKLLKAFASFSQAEKEAFHAAQTLEALSYLTEAQKARDEHYLEALSLVEKFERAKSALDEVHLKTGLSLKVLPAKASQDPPGSMGRFG